MRLLFDQNVPKPLAQAATAHVVTRAFELGWDRLINGELIAAAEAAGFDLLITADKQWRYQQNLSGRKIAIIVLPTNYWPILREHLPTIAAAITSAQPASYLELALPLAALDQNS